MASISVSKASVPLYLQGSEFYSSLDFDADEEISVPMDCCKPDDTVDNVEELRSLLSTLRFWGISTCPLTVLEYVLVGNERESCIDALTDFEAELRHLTLLKDLRNCPAEARLELAIKQKHLPAVEILIRAGAVPDEGCFKAACETNRLSYVECISGQSDRNWLTPALLEALITFGSLDIIEHLHDQGYNVVKSNAALVASVNGHLQTLKFYLALRNPDIRTNNICFASAVKGHLGCLRHACELGFLSTDASERRGMVINVCKEGHFEVLMYLHSLGVPLDSFALTCAAYGGNPKMVKYMREQGCEWTVDACAQAASHGHLACLQYLHEQGCPWDERIFAVTASHNQCACLKYLLDHGVHVNPVEALETAVVNNSVKVLQCLHEYGFPLHSALCGIALKHCHLQCLIYLHEHGCEWGDATTDVAAMKGHLKCLQYAHEHGCAWGPKTCDIAASHGHLPFLQYAYEHGCPWDVVAYRNGNIYKNPICVPYMEAQLPAEPTSVKNEESVGEVEPSCFSCCW